MSPMPGVCPAVPYRRSGSPRTSWGILPGCSAVAGSTFVPCSDASALSVLSATSGAHDSDSRAESSESRPNRVRNQGAPAA